MGHQFLEAIKTIGIFMLCSQCILHFVPGEHYGKYVKLLISVMVLAQMIAPFRALISGTGAEELNLQVETFEQELNQTLERVSMEWENKTDSVNGIDGQMLATMGEEVKTKLNNIASEWGYEVVRVEFPGISEENKETAAGAPEETAAVVTLREIHEKNQVSGIGVDNIQVSISSEEPAGDTGTAIDGEEIKNAFCLELGMREQDMRLELEDVQDGSAR